MEGVVEGLAVGLGGGGDVVGGFEAAFDFEGVDADGGEVEDEVVGGEVLRGEEVGLVAEVFVVAIEDEVVGEAAGLGALAAVGGATAERFACQALAGVGDA